MPAKGQRSSEETRQRVSESHWTKRDGVEREATIATLREKRERQIHPNFAARGITLEMVAESKAKGLRWCSGNCKAFIPESEFGTSQNPKKPARWCRKCMAAHMRGQRAAKTPQQRSDFSRKRVLDKYGVTNEWYESKLAEQDGKCALCGCAPDGDGVGRPQIPGKKPKLCVDHNHETNEVRGLLCFKCNTSLQRFEAVPDWANRAASYLAKYS